MSPAFRRRGVAAHTWAAPPPQSEAFSQPKVALEVSAVSPNTDERATVSLRASRTSTTHIYPRIYIYIYIDVHIYTHIYSHEYGIYMSQESGLAAVCPREQTQNPDLHIHKLTCHAICNPTRVSVGDLKRFSFSSIGSSGLPIGARRKPYCSA